MISLWFVTPAYRRYALSEVCFAQRADAMSALYYDHDGIESQCVVVADDDNLDLARVWGFDTVERDNDWLGRRFNDGIEHACRNGADYVVPVGSDTWLDPVLFADLPTNGTVLATRSYAVVRSDGQRLITASLAGMGYGAWAIPRELLERVGWRPCEDRRARGCDRSAFKGIRKANHRRIRFTETSLHPLAAVGFRSQEAQITPYERYRHVTEHDDPFGLLAEHYPAELVTAARRVYAA